MLLTAMMQAADERYFFTEEVLDKAENLPIV